MSNLANKNNKPIPSTKLYNSVNKKIIIFFFLFLFIYMNKIEQIQINIIV